MTCVLAHRDGHSEEPSLAAGRDESGNKNSIQAIGSTVTYLQRMTLKAALGLAASERDDDAKSATSNVITDEQREQLDRLIDEVGADVDKFLAYFKIGFLADLPAAQFNRAVQSLEAKRAK